MMNTQAKKRSAADDERNSLQQAGILQQMHWYFISTVSKLWKDCMRKWPATAQQPTATCAIARVFHLYP
jgi:hypothetical protein